VTERPSSVRWWTLSGLTGFALVSYLERSNISIAAEVMMPALGLDKVQMGQIFTSFLIGYAIFQIPGGWIGDRLGARITLAASALIWALSTIATGLLPSLFFGSAVFVVLWCVRFVLGVGEATTFPVGNRVVGAWMPLSDRATGSSIMLMGTCAASAITAPLISWLMLRVGWRMCFYLTSLPAFVMAAVWYRYSSDSPQAHPNVNQAELLHIGVERQALSDADAAVGLIPLLRQRHVLLLVLSYISEGYVLFIFVFWVYIYLVEKRGFSMVPGGWVAALPWITALLLAPAGGVACDRMATRYGRLGGARIVIMTSYALSGLLLFLAAYSGRAGISVASLSLSIGFLMCAESSFWASATYLGGARVGTLSGVMNSAGVLGGILSTSLTPLLVAHFGWLTAFGSGALMALVCAVLWLAIREPVHA
jgi:ACS family glucarate transporter-like MFS transporter